MGRCEIVIPDNIRKLVNYGKQLLSRLEGPYEVGDQNFIMITNLNVYVSQFRFILL